MLQNGLYGDALQQLRQRAITPLLRRIGCFLTPELGDSMTQHGCWSKDVQRGRCFQFPA